MASHSQDDIHQSDDEALLDEQIYEPFDPVHIDNNDGEEGVYYGIDPHGPTLDSSHSEDELEPLNQETVDDGEGSDTDDDLDLQGPSMEANSHNKLEPNNETLMYQDTVVDGGGNDCNDCVVLQGLSMDYDSHDDLDHSDNEALNQITVADDAEEEDDDDVEVQAEDLVAEIEHQYSARLGKRVVKPELPDTVTMLETADGGKVYVVGTAHFSHESQEDVAKTISLVQPDVVMLELCHSRTNTLEYDEETLLKNNSDLNFDKIKKAIKDNGVVQGVFLLVLLHMSASVTKQLGMAPGGEFRRAVKEAEHVPGCRISLGDRPIDVTLRRALAALSTWQKMRLGWAVLTSKTSIDQKEVEQLKQCDLLEGMLRELAGEFPSLTKVLLTERDMFLANSLRLAAQPVPCSVQDEGMVMSPAVVVGIVGIGHQAGIKQHWEQSIDIQELMQLPPPSENRISSRYAIFAILIVVLALLTFRLYQFVSVVAPFVLSLCCTFYDLVLVGILIACIIRHL